MSGITIMAGERQFITIPESKQTPVIDGNISPGEYRNAVFFTGFNRSGNRGLVQRYPLARMTYYGDKLFVAVTFQMLPGESLKHAVARNDYQLICLDDAIEFFVFPIKPENGRDDYFQFICNGRGAIMDSRYTPSDGQVTPQWNGNWQVASAVNTENLWTVEFSIPVTDLNIRKPYNGLQFGFDLCFDSHFDEHFTSFASAYHKREKSAIAEFSKTGPAVKFMSLGEINNGKLAVAGSVYNSAVNSLPLIIDLKIIEGNKIHFSKQLDMELSAGKEQAFEISGDLKNVSKGTFNIRVKGRDNGKVYYSQQTMFVTGKPKFKVEKILSQPLQVKAMPAPSYDKIIAEVDLFPIMKKFSGGKVEIKVYEENAKTPLASTTLSANKFVRGFAAKIVSIPGLKPGKYRVTALAYSQNGKLLKKSKSEFSVKKYPWLGNNIGISDKVPPPWTPLKISGNTVKCWGRKYKISGTGLPTQISSLQPEPTRSEITVNLLAAPIEIKAGLQSKKEVFKSGKLKINKHAPAEVDLSGNMNSKQLSVSVNSRIEYDGFYKVNLEISPKQTKTKLDSLAIEIPMDGKYVNLVNSSGDMVRGNSCNDVLPAKNGLVWNSKKFNNEMVKGNFLPFVWLGNEDRGLAWLCDNDKCWILDYNKPCLEILRKSGKAIFRINLINKPAVLDKPIRITFAIQATPVKQLPKGWRGWFRTTFENTNAFSAGVKWPTENWPEKSQIHTYGQNVPGRREKPFYWGTVHPTDIAESKKFITWQHRKKLLIYLYLNMNKTSANDPEYQDFAAEWVRIPGPKGSYSPVRSFQDYALWCLKPWIKESKLDGIYMDDVFPAPSENLINGCGWKDENGVVHAGYSLFAAREYLKRLNTMMRELGLPIPRLWIHETNTPATPYLSFGDIFLDCELLGNACEGIKYPDYIDRWPYETLGHFRAASLCRQFGAVPNRLVKNIDREHDADSAAALCLPHDVFMYTALHNKIFWPLSRFKIWEDDVKFIPYWNPKKPFSVSGKSKKIIASAWKRPDRMMLIVSNLDNQNEKVNIKLNVPEDYIAIDGSTQQLVPMKNRVISGLSVPRHNYVLLMLGAPGTFPVGDDSFGRKLSTNTGLGGSWNFNAPKETYRAEMSTWNNRINLKVKPDSYGFISQNIRLANGSVSVRIEVESGNFTQAKHGPGLILYWPNGSFVKTTLGLLPIYGSPKCRRYLFWINDKMFTGPALPFKRESYYLWKNWVKITLTNKEIIFFCSTDGKTWTEAKRVARGGQFAGSPDKLALGCGHGSKATGYENDFLQNNRKLKRKDNRYYREYYFSNIAIKQK